MSSSGVFGDEDQTNPFFETVKTQSVSNNLPHPAVTTTHNSPPISPIPHPQPIDENAVFGGDSGEMAAFGNIDPGQDEQKSGAPMPAMALPSGAPPASTTTTTTTTTSSSNSALLFANDTPADDVQPVDFDDVQDKAKGKGKKGKKAKKGAAAKAQETFTDKAADLLFGGNDGDDGDGDDDGEGEGGEGGAKKTKRRWYDFWKPSFYRPYFDVDTRDVLTRCLVGLMPVGKPFFERVEGNPDLYGPFWVTTTILFLLGIASNFAEYIAYWWAGAGEHWTYNFYKISIAAAVFYAFIAVVPVLMWLLQRFVAKGKLTAIQVYCLYGYSLTAFLIATPFCIAPVEWVRWLVIMLACVVSCASLVVAFSKAFRHDVARGLIVIGVSVLLHVILSFTYKIYFFARIRVPASFGSN